MTSSFFASDLCHLQTESARRKYYQDLFHPKRQLRFDPIPSLDLNAFVQLLVGPRK